MGYKIKEITDGKKGSLLNLVKIKIFPGETSLAEVGTKITGIFAKDIKCGEPVYVTTEGENYRHVTSEVFGISFKKEKMTIQTRTSIYEQERK